MQDRGNTEINPLQSYEMTAAWQKYCPEVVTNIPRFIGNMGLKKSLKRLLEKTAALGQPVPTCRQIVLILVQDIELHTDIFVRVEREFRKAVPKGRVDRDHVGGWINRATQWHTWKLAVSKAKRLIREVPLCTEGTDALTRIGTTKDSPDELLADRQCAERYAGIVAKLSIEDRQLFDAKLAGKGYATLAAARGTTPAALKTEVSRLCKEIVAAVQGDEAIAPVDDEDDDEAA